MWDRASSGANRRGSRRAGRVCTARVGAPGGAAGAERRARLPAAGLGPSVSRLPGRPRRQRLGRASQTFTVTSSNPDIGATVAQGEFLTMNVSHTSSGPGDPTFSGSIVFQLFNDLTPNTATNIETFVNMGFYNGLHIFRVANEFPDANGYILQGGSTSNELSGTPAACPGRRSPTRSSSNWGSPTRASLPWPTRASTAAGRVNTDDSQFFITNSDPAFLDDNYTIFGQVVSGLNLVNDMTRLPWRTTRRVRLADVSDQPDRDQLGDRLEHQPRWRDPYRHHPGAGRRDLDHHGDRNRPGDQHDQTQSFVVTVVANPNASSIPLILKPIAYSATQTYTANTPQTIQLGADPAVSDGQ